MPTEAFNFDYYLTDYIAMFRKAAEQAGMAIPPELDPFLRELERATDLRDTDLEDYLAVGSYSPSVGVQRAATQSIGTAGLPTAISFDTEDWLSTELFEWDGATKITVQQAGIVDIKANLRYAANATGWRSAFIYVNGLQEIAGDERAAYAIGQPRLSVSVSYPALEGDYIELYAYQNSGGNLNVDLAKLQVAWLGQSG